MRDVPQRWSQDRIDAVAAWTVVQAGHAVGRALYGLFAEQQLTPVQFGVLAQLAATPGITSSQLARAVLVRPQSMADLLTGLVDRGLVRRTGPGGRGRPVPIELTDAGRATLDDAGRALARFHDPRHLGLTRDDQQRLTADLRRVIAALEDTGA